LEGSAINKEEKRQNREEGESHTLVNSIVFTPKMLLNKSTNQRNQNQTERTFSLTFPFSFPGTLPKGTWHILTTEYSKSIYSTVDSVLPSIPAASSLAQTRE